MSNAYLTAGKKFVEKALDWVNDDIRCLLVTSSYTFDETHDFVSQITNELAGGGYARVALAGKATALDDAGHHTHCDANDTTFPALQAAAGTPAAAIVYKYDAGGDGASQLIAYCSLTAPPVPNGGDYKIVWGANGILTIGNA